MSISLSVFQPAPQPQEDNQAREAKRQERSKGRFIPTMGFRWYVDKDGQHTLQQRCTTTGGTPFWRDMDKFTHEQGERGDG